LLRLPERFRAARDDFDRPRVPDPLRDFVVVDRRDTVFFDLPRERARALRGLATDFLLGRRLRGAFGTALELFMTLRTVIVANDSQARYLTPTRAAIIAKYLIIFKPLMESFSTGRRAGLCRADLLSLEIRQQL
jgi:hypothetical protein